MLPFSIKIRAGCPPCDQLVGAVRKAIALGELKHEQPFPSVRRLSRELRISPTTAHRAVGILKSSGLLAVRPGVGMVVNAPRGPGLDEKLALLRPAAQRLASEARELNLSLRHLKGLISDCFDEGGGVPGKREDVDDEQE